MRRLAIFVVLGVAVLMLIVATPRPAVTQYSSPVRVMNTPLPVTVNSMPNVTIDTSNPIVVQDSNNPSRQPITLAFSRYADPGFTQTACGTTDSYIYKVPSGKILVVEHVNYFGVTGAANQSPAVDLSGRRYRLIEFQGASYGAGPMVFLDQLTRFYLQPEETLWVCIYRQEATNGFSVSGYIDGYLVDVP